MKLHFNREQTLRLLEHSRSATSRLPNGEQLFDPQFLKAGAPTRACARAEDIDGSKIPAGLWLVGSDGIYLMSNGPNHPKDLETGENAAIYAVECDPKADPDNWWFVKRSAFGGDDGCEFLDASAIQAACDATAPDPFVWLEVTPKGISVPVLQPASPKPKRASWKKKGADTNASPQPGRRHARKLRVAP